MADDYFGYILDVLAVPALALVSEDGWIAACMLFVVQRIGKAVKKPAKDTIMSFAASQEGVGKSFGIQELLDQLGAFLGPVLLYLVMLVKTEGTTFTIYATCFAVLAIPGAITLALLFYTKINFRIRSVLSRSLSNMYLLKFKVLSLNILSALVYLLLVLSIML